MTINLIFTFNVAKKRDNRYALSNRLVLRSNATVISRNIKWIRTIFNNKALFCSGKEFYLFHKSLFEFPPSNLQQTKRRSFTRPASKLDHKELVNNERLEIWEMHPGAVIAEFLYNRFLTRMKAFSPQSVQSW
jgi:hypothetical protein